MTAQIPHGETSHVHSNQKYSNQTIQKKSSTQIPLDKENPPTVSMLFTSSQRSTLQIFPAFRILHLTTILPKNFPSHLPAHQLPANFFPLVVFSGPNGKPEATKFRQVTCLTPFWSNRKHAWWHPMTPSQNDLNPHLRVCEHRDPKRHMWTMGEKSEKNAPKKNMGGTGNDVVFIRVSSLKKNKSTKHLKMLITCGVFVSFCSPQNGVPHLSDSPKKKRREEIEGSFLAVSLPLGAPHGVSNFGWKISIFWGIFH